MPERKVNLLHLFIRQGMGRLSKRARSSEFAQLTDAEVEEVEKLYKESFAGAGHEKDNEMP
jgi:hypothetical protein